MEIDLSIALLQRERWEHEIAEAKQQEQAKYDPKRLITYSLEELIDGIKSGKQFLYTLKMEFEPKLVLNEQLKIPAIVDFFDVIEEEPANLVMASNQRGVSMVIGSAPCEQMKQSFPEWISQVKSALKRLGIQMNLQKTRTLKRLDYFCYETPTSKGTTYNVAFRLKQAKLVYVGTLNCMAEEKAGMGLMLEAMVHVMEEMNQ